MAIFRVGNIKWETGGECPVLPEDVTLECSDKADIADALSDRHGWLVIDFVVLDKAESSTDANCARSAREQLWGARCLAAALNQHRRSPQAGGQSGHSIDDLKSQISVAFGC